MYKLAAIGDKDSVLCFKALGLDVFFAVEPLETAMLINRLAKEGYAVIFITEQSAEKATDTIKKYKTAPFPAIIPIPSNRGTTGMGIRGLKANVEKAIGADILFKEENDV